MGNKVLERLEARKKAKAGQQAKDGDGSKETKLSVVKDEETQEADPAVNPPEGADQGEPPDDKEEKPTTGRTRKKRPEKPAKVETIPSTSATSGGVILRALEAAWEVLAEDIAERVKKLK